MQRVNIKGAVSQKNVISGVVHKGGNGDRRSDHYSIIPTTTAEITTSSIFTFVQKEIPIFETEVIA